MKIKTPHIYSFFFVLAAALLLPASAAFAGPPAPPAPAAGTLGALMTTLQADMFGLTVVFEIIAYIAGIFMGVAGVFKFKDHVDNPQTTPISAGVKRFLAGGMFLSAPYMMSAAVGTLFGTGAGTGVLTTSGRASMAAVGPGTPGNVALDQMVVNLMNNIGQPVEILLMVFTYMSAFAFLLLGISRLTKRMEEGPKGPAGTGTILTFITAGALFAFGDMMGAFSTSMFGDAQVAGTATVTMAGLNPVDAQRIQAVIEGVMAFVMIVGYIAFIRGWFVLRAFADGSQGATLAQGLTFLFGGALAINLGELVNILQATVGVGGNLTFI